MLMRNRRVGLMYSIVCKNIQYIPSEVLGPAHRAETSLEVRVSDSEREGEDVCIWWPSPFRIDYQDFILLIKLFSENTTERDLCSLLNGKGTDHVMLA